MFTSAIPCYIEYLEIPDNMMRSLVDEGRRVLLRCKPGNRPVNGTLGQIDCVKGNWTGEIGACVGETSICIKTYIIKIRDLHIFFKKKVT